jgi:hypothetical protein
VVGLVDQEASQGLAPHPMMLEDLDIPALKTFLPISSEELRLPKAL